MTKKKQQTEEISPLRVPKAKNKLGLKINQIPMPHLQLVEQKAEPEPYKDIDSETVNRLISQSNSPSLSSLTRQTLNKEDNNEISPSRNYQKVPNSHTKKAIPEGFFKTGKSKHLYDVLYSVTRGAIEPKRSIRISKSKLMKLAGIGSRITFDSIINHFEANGLLKVTIYPGQHNGNEFEVFTYDEIETLPSQTSLSSLTSTAQYLDRLVCLDTRQTSQGLNDENNKIYESLKTFFKTFKKIDDEKPILAVMEMLNEAARAATGSDLTQKEFDALPELFKIIIEEISLARLKTNSVTNYTRFAATHLRRQLNLARQKPVSVLKPFELENEDGKESEQSQQIEPFEAEPLGDAERENLLVIYKPVYKEKGIEALENVRGIITKEDWQWLIDKLQRD